MPAVTGPRERGKRRSERRWKTAALLLLAGFTGVASLSRWSPAFALAAGGATAVVPPGWHGGGGGE
ncbi:MAG: hypothetical protein ACM3RP_02145, partial [Chitinophagales bacterium]